MIPGGTIATARRAKSMRRGLRVCGMNPSTRPLHWLSTTGKQIGSRVVSLIQTCVPAKRSAFHAGGVGHECEGWDRCRASTLGDPDLVARDLPVRGHAGPPGASRAHLEIGGA